MQLFATGLSFVSAPVALRERAAVPKDQLCDLLQHLFTYCDVASAAVLSTCNRTEFYFTRSDDRPFDVESHIAGYLDPKASVDMASHFRSFVGADALRHIFRVAAGLESMIPGENEVLGQFKRAHESAQSANTLDGALDFVMRQAITTGKQVRSETTLGRRISGVSGAAVECMRKTLGDHSDLRTLVMGAGDVSSATVRKLRQLTDTIYIVSRHGASAKRLAEEVGAHAIAHSDIDRIVGDLDCIVCATNSTTPLFTDVDIQRIQSIRSQRPLCILDMAVPRNVDPRAGVIPGVTLYDIDAVGASADGLRSEQRAAFHDAEVIVDRSVSVTEDWLVQQDLIVPTIRALTEQMERTRAATVEHTLARMGNHDERTREAVAHATGALLKRIIHSPIQYLKDRPADAHAVQTVREIFALAHQESDRKP